MVKQRIRVSIVVALSLALTPASVCLSAQSLLDTVELVHATVDLIVEQATQSGDQHAPFALIDSCLLGWGHAVAAALRAQHKDLIALRQPHSLQLSVGDITVHGDTARVTVHWVRCTGRDDMLNW